MSQIYLLIHFIISPCTCIDTATSMGQALCLAYSLSPGRAGGFWWPWLLEYVCQMPTTGRKANSITHAVQQDLCPSCSANMALKALFVFMSASIMVIHIVRQPQGLPEQHLARLQAPSHLTLVMEEEATPGSLHHHGEAWCAVACDSLRRKPRLWVTFSNKLH